MQSTRFTISILYRYNVNTTHTLRAIVPRYGLITNSNFSKLFEYSVLQLFCYSLFKILVSLLNYHYPAMRVLHASILFGCLYTWINYSTTDGCKHKCVGLIFF